MPLMALGQQALHGRFAQSSGGNIRNPQQTQVIVRRPINVVAAIGINQQRICVDVSGAAPTALHIAVGNSDAGRADLNLITNECAICPNDAIAREQFRDAWR